jgi:hypothetical protein
MASKPALQKVHKWIINTEKEDKCNHENMGKINLIKWINEQMKTEKNQIIKQQENDRNYYISFNNNPES